MQKIYHYITYFLFLLILISCEKEKSEEIPTDNQIEIWLSRPQEFQTKVIDEDNLASEQTINNLSVFMTDVNSNTITYKYVNTGFSISGNYQIITLPLDGPTLQTKNIYVIANYDNLETLENVATLEDLSALRTPEVDKDNNLDPIKGLCMFGNTLNFNFTTNSTAIVGLERTCAKLRIQLIFPETPSLSTRNSFLIQQAAKYTFVRENLSTVLPLTDYFNFAAPIDLIDDGTQTYTNIVYIYQAPQTPTITIYTHINNSTEPQEFTASLPLPDRNYLYDILIEIFDEVDVTRSYSIQEESRYKYTCKIQVYDWQGNQIEEY